MVVESPKSTRRNGFRPVRAKYVCLHPTVLKLFTGESSQVIVTSYLFPDAKFSLERLKSVSSAVGKGRLVVDVRYGSLRSVCTVITPKQAVGGRESRGSWP